VGGSLRCDPDQPIQGDHVSQQIPLVDYLVLDRRNACAACSGTEFRKVPIPTEGEVKAFTIVSMAAPGIPVPFVAAVVDCGGTSVRANVVNVPPDPDHVKLGMKVRLTTFPIGTDSAGTEAIGFGFEPLS
jgi:uncharacterized OB-fold protein